MALKDSNLVQFYNTYNIQRAAKATTTTAMMTADLAISNREIAHCAAQSFALDKMRARVEIEMAKTAAENNEQLRTISCDLANVGFSINEMSDHINSVLEKVTDAIKDQTELHKKHYDEIEREKVLKEVLYNMKKFQDYCESKGDQLQLGFGGKILFNLVKGHGFGTKDLADLKDKEYYDKIISNAEKSWKSLNNESREEFENFENIYYTYKELFEIPIYETVARLIPIELKEEGKEHDEIIEKQKQYIEKHQTILDNIEEHINIFLAHHPKVCEYYPYVSEYVGERKDGKPDGQGTKTWHDGRKYVGEFKAGKPNGQGTITLPGGGKYVGEWKDGECHGHGTYTWPDGSKYVGEYKDDLLNGQGTYTWPDGSKYVGEWKDGYKNGQGTMTFTDGGMYVGEWKDGKQDGQGTSTSSWGNKYVGDHKDGEPHGQGNFTCFDGSKYVGEYKYGKFHGQGTWTSVDGIIYAGEFEDGELNGQGTVTWPDGRKYVGEIIYWKLNGQGTFAWPDGQKYVGEFKDDNLNGQGILYKPNGKIKCEGRWKDDQFVGK